MQIEILNLNKTYESKDKKAEPVEAIKSFSLKINSGELIGVLGPSGSGKTTLLYSLAGLTKVDSGKIYFDEENIVDLPCEKREIGFVFQNYALYPRLNVYDNISFPLINRKLRIPRIDKKVKDIKDLIRVLTQFDTLKSTVLAYTKSLDFVLTKKLYLYISRSFKVTYKIAKQIMDDYLKVIRNREKIGNIVSTYDIKLHKELGRIEEEGFTIDANHVLYKNGEMLYEERKLDKDEIDQKVVDALKMVSLYEKINSNISELSGGEKQRVAIARALIKSPKLLLLDEPLSNLDASLKENTRNEIRRIQKETGITTIMVTHDQEDAINMCDRIVLMNKGRNAQFGTYQEIFENPNSLFTAEFLGSGSSVSFEGEVNKKRVYINGKKVFTVNKLENQKIRILIRNDAFNLAVSGSTKERIVFNVSKLYQKKLDKFAEVNLEGQDDKKYTLRINDCEELKLGLNSFNINKEKIFLFNDLGERL